MPDEITPALTAAEWSGEEGLLIGTGSPKLGHWVELERGDDGVEFDFSRTPLGSTSFTVGGDDRHKVAALCLHGQPFGFTREDVNLLNAVLTRGPDLGEPERIAALAARIAALLPPEEPERDHLVDATEATDASGIFERIAEAKKHTGKDESRMRLRVMQSTIDALLRDHHFLPTRGAGLWFAGLPVEVLPPEA